MSLASDSGSGAIPQENDRPQRFQAPIVWRDLGASGQQSQQHVLWTVSECHVGAGFRIPPTHESHQHEQRALTVGVRVEQPRPVGQAQVPGASDDLMSRRPQLKSNGDNERRAACRVDKDRWEQMQEHKLDQPLPCDAVLVNAADLVDAVRSRYVQQHFHHHDDSFLMLNTVLVLFQAVSVPGPIQGQLVAFALALCSKRACIEHSLQHSVQHGVGVVKQGRHYILQRRLLKPAAGLKRSHRYLWDRCELS
eukprot:143304-Rhodomonas_salina.2